MAVSLTTKPPETRLITGEELYAMGDIGPCELVDGRIVLMSPTGYEHGAYESNFLKALRDFVDNKNLGKVFVGEVGIFTQRNPDRVRAADVVYISAERFSQVTSKGYIDAPPELVVEVMSPGDTWSDVTEKLREYFDFGVTVVWIADPRSKTVFVFRSLTEVREFRPEDDLTTEDVLPGMRLRVASLFEI